MAAIQTGSISFRNVYQYDMFDITFEISGIDLTGKTLLCQVRESADSEVVLEFNEDDGSLTKSVDSNLVTSVRLYKTGDEMTLPPLSAYGVRPIIYYYLTIIMFTDDSVIEDVQTIIKGTLEMVSQITRIP